MHGIAAVVFSLPSVAAEEAFVSDRLVPLFDRVSARDDARCKFFRYGRDPDLPGGEVRLKIEGEYDAVVEAERERWDRWRESGWVRTWTVEAVDRPQAALHRERHSEETGRVVTEAGFLAAQSVRDFYETFETPPPAAPADGPGYWAFLHFHANALGYDWYDEIDACVAAVRNRARSLAAYHGPETAVDALEEARAELAEAASELRAEDRSDPE